MRINTFKMAVVLTSFACFFASQARADMLTGDVWTKSFIARFADGSLTESVYASPMNVKNLTSGDNFNAFCGDFRTSTSSAFSSTGQAYGSMALDSPSLSIYTTNQKAAINQLVGNVYSSAFDLDGNMLNAAAAVAIQVCLWEILTEESGALGIHDGTFQIVSGLDTGTLNMIDSWIAALTGEISWDELGYNFTQYDIDVYVADGGMNASQTLINVRGESAATPEPATMAIFGFGIGAVIPFVRRMRKHNAV